MKAHIFITLIALVISACASREHVSENTKNNEPTTKYSYADGSANRFR